MAETTADGIDKPAEEAVDLGAILATAWRGRWVILLITLLAMLAAGAFIAFATTPLYRATSVVMLETRQEQIIDLQSVVTGLSGDTAVVNSEAEVLRSRSLMEKVVAQQGLADDPEFNEALRAPTLASRLSGLVSRGWGSGRAATRGRREIDTVIDALLERITVRNVPLSLVFEITVETTDAAKSARIADAIATLYIDSQVEEKRSAMEQATGWLAQRVAALRLELEEAEERLAAFKSGAELVSAEGLQALERRLKELRERVGTAEAEAGRSSRKRAQIAAMRDSAAELEARIARQGEDLITLQQLTREAEASRLLYGHFLGRLKETSAQQGIQRPDGRVISAAVVPEAPSAPRPGLLLAGSGIAGMVAGLALVLAREARSVTFRSAAQLESATGLTVMGQVPAIPARGGTDPMSWLARKPFSAPAEAVRNLRTSLLLSGSGAPPKLIAMASALPDEGKTTLTLALARDLVAMGRSVLVIDGDIRRRAVGARVDLDADRGLLAAVSGRTALADSVIRDDATGADILPAEAGATSKPELFSSPGFAELAEAARGRYDHVLVDTPPVLLVPDARMIGRVADSVVLSVRWDRTARGQVAEALRLFRTAGVGVSGLVLNRIDPKGMRRYGLDGTYGAYGTYGSAYYAE